MKLHGDGTILKRAAKTKKIVERGFCYIIIKLSLNF